MEMSLQESTRVALVFAAIGCAGCVPVSDNDLMSTGGHTIVDVNTYPLVERAGTLTASELIGLFEDVCLEHFADPEAMRAAFVKHGFSVKKSDLDVRREYNEFFLITQNAPKGIVGSFGRYIIIDAGLYDNCSLEAYVTEPDTIVGSDVATTLAVGRKVLPRPSYSGRVWRLGDGRLAEIAVEEPGIDTGRSADGGLVRERQKLKIGIKART
jgi:hypothetical protein